MALAGAFCGPSTHGLPPMASACPPQVPQHCCCGATPCWHQPAHTQVHLHHPRPTSGDLWSSAGAPWE